MSQEEIVNKFKAMKAEIDEIANQLVSIESDQNEYALVLETLKPVEEERRCYRLIQGHLVESTVKDIRPMVSQNLDKIRELLDKLKKQYEEKDKALQEYQTKHKIVVRRA